MEEQVKLYDLLHWEHNRYNGFDLVGKTTYNVDNKRQPVIKHGQAPCEMLEHQTMWFTLEDAESTLLGLGFEKKNSIEYWRKGE
ncbi:MAG: hypothetical protein WC449_05015 [Candidatus Paceibacterota bacterium]